MRITYIFLFLLTMPLYALERSAGSQEAELYFISPLNGDVVTKNVIVNFGLKAFGIAPAGVDFNQTGHHHLIVDAELPPLGQPIPSDMNHIHFGKGQTEVMLDLASGTHTLQLLLGDFRHVPHEPAIFSKQIVIQVP